MSVIDTLVEVTLAERDDFLKIRETLQRIGVASKKNKTLYQSCHILHKQGKYYILSFKELFLLDGKESTLTDDDIARRNTIAKLLEDWGLLTIVDPSKVKAPKAAMTQIKILPFGEKSEWNLVEKYTVGKKR